MSELTFEQAVVELEGRHGFGIDHIFSHRLCHQKICGQVYLDHFIPVVFREILSVCQECCTGAVNQNVNLADLTMCSANATVDPQTGVIEKFSSSSVTTGHAYLNLQPSGNVGQSVWYGGRAYNKSRVTVDTASAQINGRVGATVHREGRASDGGSVSIRRIKITALLKVLKFFRAISSSTVS